MFQVLVSELRGITIVKRSVGEMELLIFNQGLLNVKLEVYTMLCVATALISVSGPLSLLLKMY